MRLSSLILVCIVMTGCGSSIGRGTTLYQQRSYIEAAEVFERTQNRLASMDPIERARYGLYRGLTLMALGDLRGAERWLDYAEAQEHSLPGLLARDERTMLTQGRMDLGERRQATWPKPEPRWAQGVAATTTSSDTQ
jgi:hypothetical protein